MKLIRRFTALLLMTALLCGLLVHAGAFDFPEPDWGALYDERYRMATATEFSLYAEGPLSTAPYYGAKFEPIAGTYLGSTINQKDGDTTTADNLLPLGSCLTYVQGMGQADLYWPSNQMIRNGNMIAMVGWTISDLDAIDYDYVDSMLSHLNSYGKPMLVRFANEMNISSIGNDPEKYVQVFRKVADMIHRYPNLGVVWSPNDRGNLRRPFEYYYPGDQYVDWIGVSCYMMKYFQGNPDTPANDTVYFMTGDYAWATSAVQPILEFMEKNHIQKPLMLSECGVETANKYGEDDQAWATPRLRNLLWYLVMKYPQIKMINLFNRYQPGESQGYEVNDVPYAAAIVQKARDSGVYLTEYGQSPDFVFAPAEKAGTLTADRDVIRLYTMAIDYQKPEMTVSYAVDGKWYHASSKAPYICNLKVSALSDGKHTLTIWTDGYYKEYTFYKKGKCIRFGAEPEAWAVNAAEHGGIVAGFKDVYADDYYADAVRWTAENEITKGTSLDQFSPKDTVSRAQAVTFLWRAFGQQEPRSMVSPFKDVQDPGEYYYKAVLWASENNITIGVGGGRFDVNGNVQCDQMITFLYRAAGGEPLGDDWAERSELWAKENDLLNGIPGDFKGQTDCPRSDVVYYIWKFLS